MKISLITVCYNSAAFIRTALDSVFAQKGCDLEYLVIDGGSTDGTVDILKEYESKFKVEVEQRRSGLQAASEKEESHHCSPSPSTFTYRWLSEKDNGMYDALNKGRRLSTGEVIGILNADDVLATDDILAQIAAAFTADPTLDGTYGDIRFVSDKPNEVKVKGEGEERRSGLQAASEKEETPPLFTFTSSLHLLRAAPTKRYCTGRFFRPWMFRFGVQTAHPSTFFRRSCFERWGDYSLNYGMYGDFELLCRFIWKHRARMRYLPLCTTLMRLGGASTDGVKTTIKINQTDIRALRDNGCTSNLLFLYARYPFKIWGYVFKRKS